jgi:pilus assembly protein CpaE
MQLFFFNAGVDPIRSGALEPRIRARLPGVRVIGRLEEVTRALAGGSNQEELACILFPVEVNESQSLDRMVSIATEFRHSVFFIFISDNISASDYKRLVQTGGADWASTANAPDEIAEILARISGIKQHEVEETRPASEPVMVAFVPSSGGVGNSTIAMETGVQVKLAKRTRSRRVCLVDLDFQNSHVCDLLDIEPRMQIHEIASNPDRLDAQLFDLFVSHHTASGLDVLGAPRSRDKPVDLNVKSLEALFQMVGSRYDLVLLDLPVPWFSWTRQLLSAVEVVFVLGINTIPGLRQVADTLQAVRGVDRVPAKVSVVLNRCESQLIGGVARRQHVKNLLANEEVHYIREDTESAVQSANTGIPMAGRGKISKDIAAIVPIVSEAKPVAATAQGS